MAKLVKENKLKIVNTETDLVKLFDVKMQQSPIFTRDSIYAIARMPRQFRLSVCPSHACIVSKRLNVSGIIEILLLSDRPITLVFRHQGLLCKSDGVTPNGGAKYKGVAIFDQYAAISRKR